MAKTLTAGRIGRTVVELRLGHVTRVAAEAIVNAANESLSGEGLVSGEVHRIAGATIAAQCRIIGGCPAGNAVITGAGDLTASYVIHAVAPRRGTPNDAQLLRSAYRSALLRADEVKVKSIAIPPLGTIEFGFPIEQAAPIALDAVGSYLSGTASTLERIIFVLSTEPDYEAYRRLFPKRGPA